MELCISHKHTCNYSKMELTGQLVENTVVLRELNKFMQNINHREHI